MLKPRWHTKEELIGHVAFYCHSSFDHLDNLATDWKKGQWYWTLDDKRYYGPYKNRKMADAAYKEAALGG